MGEAPLAFNCLAASNTFNVPITFTFAPNIGLSRQVGTCKPAKWIIASGLASTTAVTNSGSSTLPLRNFTYKLY